MDDEYTLEDLKELLENIKKNGSGDLNFPKALLSLVQYIEKINYYIDFLDACIPQKYKKQFPKENESPFFEHLGFKPPPDPKEFEEARLRLKVWSKQRHEEASQSSSSKEEPSPFLP